MQAIVDNLLASYEKVGNGPTVLMLHGWGDSHQTFSELSRELEDKFSIISLDLPGFGGTQAPKTVWSLNDYCDFVAKFLVKIDEKKPYAIVGHSNGGAISIRGLANGIFESDKLVLLASSGVRDVYKGRKKALRLAAKAAKAATYPLPKSVTVRIKKHAYKSVGSDMFVAEHLQETFKKIVGDDVRNDAKKLKLPTLLIYGSEDNATPVRYGELFRDAIPGSMLQVIDGAGHHLHHDNPKEVYYFVKEFL